MISNPPIGRITLADNKSIQSNNVFPLKERVVFGVCDKEQKIAIMMTAILVNFKAFWRLTFSSSVTYVIITSKIEITEFKASINKS